MAKILIVDDEPLNRELLQAYLDGSGHEVLEASSGEEALSLAEQSRPDLVLLDVRMPGLSGFEAAASLKESRPDEFLPVVLVTALSDHASRVEGLRAGADEFLTKPIDRHELTLRIANLLSLRKKEAALIRRNRELVELQRFRDEMSAMIVHDLKNPLTAVIANIAFAADGGDAQGDTLDALHDAKAAAGRALRLIANLLDVARMEERQLRLHRSELAVQELVVPLVQERQYQAAARQVAIENAVEPETRFHGDPELIGRVLENVFDNALRFTPPGGRIGVRAVPMEKGVRLTIGNSGPPVPVESRARIFEKFAQTGSAIGRMNLGLGLYFCRLAVEAHGGRIWVDETAELPTVFVLELPA